ncbi:hypothetical protein P9869_00985 [Streptomyces ossamyceticus]|nr:hypothetical protein [Streptomyces ossamyceticus]
MSRNTRALRRPGRRAAVAAGLVLAVGLGLSTQAVAQAAAPAPAKASAAASAKASAASRSITGFNGDLVTQTADFYGAYIDAKDDATGPDTKLAKALRTHYLEPAFAKRLAAWEKKNNADGVLRAQNVPVEWTVSEGRNGLETIVSLTYGGGESPTTTTSFVVKHEVAGGITDIRPTSAAPAKPSPTKRSVSGRTGDSVTRIADFYGAYVDAKDAPEGPDTKLATALRTHYLEPAFAKRLAAWEKKNNLDGVLRAQNVPVDWTVSEGRNSREIRVTHAFGGGETPTVTTDLVVKLEPVSGDVTDIRRTSTH